MSLSNPRHLVEHRREFDRPTCDNFAREAPDHVEPLSRSFRFVDPNPWRPGVSYSASRFAELPQYAAQQVPVTAHVWDDLVRADATDRVLDVWRSFSLGWLRAWLVDRARFWEQVPGCVCPDCWGCGVAMDWDGSITGTYDVLYPCGCGESLREEIAATHSHTWPVGRTEGATLGWPGAGVLGVSA